MTTSEQSLARNCHSAMGRQTEAPWPFRATACVFTVTQTAVFQLVRTGDQLCDATRLLDIGAEEVGIFLAGG